MAMDLRLLNQEIEKIEGHNNLGIAVFDQVAIKWGVPVPPPELDKLDKAHWVEMGLEEVGCQLDP